MAVDSVFAQDYPALEAMLVDDGSESAEALAGLDAIEAGIQRTRLAGDSAGEPLCRGRAQRGCLGRTG